MNIVDSSCWLEFIEDSLIGNEVALVIADVEHLLVPTIVLYEVCRKLTAMRGSTYAQGFIQGMLNAQVVPLDVPLSISAASISQKHQLAMADSIIYATAIQHDAILWTADKHFEDLPNVRYFDKTQSEPDA
jgi:predicted nucleic acid-binding protein